MAKAQNLDKFKYEVYNKIGTLERLELDDFKDENLNRMGGCFGLIFKPIIKFSINSANESIRERINFDELTVKADELLAEKEIKDLLCANLDAKVKLPIDAAYKLTPVLYELAAKDEKRIPLDATLFAIICRKITKKGTENYCR